MATTIKWGSATTEDDLADALLYLSLVATDLQSYASQWSTGPAQTFMAKDLLRLSGLAALASTNAGVKKYLERFKNKTTINPVLLVRGSLTTGLPVVIAEGYHRVCACYWSAEDTPVRVLIASRM